MPGDTPPHPRLVRVQGDRVVGAQARLTRSLYHKSSKQNSRVDGGGRQRDSQSDVDNRNKASKDRNLKVSRGLLPSSAPATAGLNGLNPNSSLKQLKYWS